MNLRCKVDYINKFEIINLGVEGYDIPYELERYKIRGVKYSPNMILWMLFDPLRIKEFMAPIINKCTENLSYTDNKDYFAYKDCWYKSEKILMKKFGEAGIRSHLKNSLESIFNYFNKDIIILDFLNNHSKILEAVRQIKILNYFRIAKSLTYGEMNNEYYLYDGHPNKEGHKTIAEDVFNYLVQNKLIPCN